MAGQANDALPNKHALIAGGSGAGKTTYARGWYKSHERVVLWDPDRSHAARGVVYTDNLSAFIRGLATGARAKRCRLAYAPVLADEEGYQRFCHALWQVADCRYPVTVVTEELQELTGSGPAREWHKTLLTRGRKYGLTLCYITQRPQEIDTTTRGQTPHKVTGQLDRRADIDAMSREMNIGAEVIGGLMELNGDAEVKKRLHFVERVPGRPAKPISIALPRRQNARAKPARKD